MLATQTRKLDAILFTHAHKDHTAGLDDVRAFNWINKQPILLFSERPVFKALKTEYAYIFKDEDEKYPGVPEVELNEIDQHPFDVFDIHITPIRAFHHLLPVLGFRIGGFSYLTDASRIPKDSMEKLSGSEQYSVKLFQVFDNNMFAIQGKLVANL
jgi:phosphoribosyl 1,2-cyclic phosphate phosphodiesterase